jgi:hypothetical protein
MPIPRDSGGRKCPGVLKAIREQSLPDTTLLVAYSNNHHIPSHLVVRGATTQQQPPAVRIGRLSPRRVSGRRRLPPPHDHSARQAADPVSAVGQRWEYVPAHQTKPQGRSGLSGTGRVNQAWGATRLADLAVVQQHLSESAGSRTSRRGVPPRPPMHGSGRATRRCEDGGSPPSIPTPARRFGPYSDSSTPAFVGPSPIAAQAEDSDGGAIRIGDSMPWA